MTGAICLDRQRLSVTRMQPRVMGHRLGLPARFDAGLALQRRKGGAVFAVHRTATYAASSLMFFYQDLRLSSASF